MARSRMIISEKNRLEGCSLMGAAFFISGQFQNLLNIE
jgi:hypothetical protein